MQVAGLSEGALVGLIGGPPCQGFSTIGHRRVCDDRNNLFVKFFSLVRDCKPAFFVAENVMGILDPTYDSVREAAFSLVSGKYDIITIPIIASDYGAPTSRKRVFFIGHRKDISIELSAEDFTQFKSAATPTVAEALDGLPARIHDTWIQEEKGWRKALPPKHAKFAEHMTCSIAGIGDTEALEKYKSGLVSGCLGTRHSDKLRLRYHALGPGEQDPITKSVRLRPNGLCPTLRAGTGSDRGSFQAVRPIHPTIARVITPREAARLQGFPDWFRFCVKIVSPIPRIKRSHLEWQIYFLQLSAHK